MHNVLIVIVAVIMGVSPLPTTPQHQPVVDSGKPAVVQLEQKASAASKPKSEETKKPAEVKSTVKKEQTWQDNPQKCNQETQYISKDAPFNCINKPKDEAPAPQRAAKAVAPSGSCADWIAGAGIGDVANAQELIRRESGCNPNAVNPSSGACGVAQELPCGKSGCSLGDGACQVKWMNSYVLGRYGSWANAVAWHDAHNWY